MTAVSRRLVLTGVVASAMGGVAACTDSPGGSSTETAESPTVVARAAPESATVVGDAAQIAAAVSGLLLERSRVAVLSTDDEPHLRTAARLAETGRWPVLVGSVDAPLPEATLAELRRLAVDHLVVVTDGEGELADLATQNGLAGVTVAAVPVDASPSPSPSPGANPPDGVPVGEFPGTLPAILVAAPSAAATAALATAAAFGVPMHTAVVDPREEATVMAALRTNPTAALLVVATDAATAETLLSQSIMAQRAPELPGGGVTVFPHRRMIALYGHPGVPGLGLLGEQGVQASIERVGEYVDRYSALVEEPVVPAFEIIASVATGSAGEDGNYSKLWPPETFRAWVDAAKAAGVYVVLDLQPGRTDFLTQATAYEELLVEPHVGLALDPEWRLGPDERHLVRIGSVEAAEINAVSEWLAGLVRAHELPQKVLTLHQFRLSMIEDRAAVRTDHPELAVVLHADGQGSQGAKQDTWSVLKKDLPEGMWLGWKNFYDEDEPMLTPEQTVAQVDPVPWFVSYQ